MEEVKTNPQHTPEQQAAYDKEMKEQIAYLFNIPIVELHAQTAFCLADVVRAVIDGQLKPEDIPPTADELIVRTYDAVSRKMLAREMLGRKTKGTLDGRG